MRPPDASAGAAWIRAIARKEHASEWSLLSRESQLKRIGTMAENTTCEELEQRIALLENELARRKRAENSILALKGKIGGQGLYALLVESATDGIWLLDKAFMTVYVNPAMEKNLGYEAQEMIGRSWYDFGDPEWVARAQELEKRRESGIEEPHQFLFIHKDGRKVMTRIATTPLYDENGEFTGELGILSDITRQQEAADAMQVKDMLNVVANSAGIGMCLLNPDYTIEWYNDLLSQWFGTLEKVRGRNCFEVFEAKNVVCPDCPSRVSFETGETASVLHCNTTTGAARTWAVTATPIRDAGNNVIRVVEIIQDITDQKRAEDALRESNSQLEQAVTRANEMAVQTQAADIAKSRFLTSMSHEIRTPLNAILGFSQLMQGDPDLTLQQRQRVETINRSGEHLLALLNNILELSKIDAGRQTLQQKTFDLLALLDNLAIVFRQKAEIKGLSFDVEGIDCLPRYIVGDEQKLRQVLTNLLSNAVKFTLAGGIRLQARVKAAGMRMAVLVEDTGPGIRAEEMDLLFMAFEQAEAGRSNGSGSGLGLAISQQYARLMGGDVSITSKEGRGSVFCLDIPVKPGTTVVTAKIPDARQLRRIEAVQPRYRVLVVDDTELSRRFLVMMLKRAGFDVSEADSGSRAVAVFSGERPHIVLMDQRMPGMNGDDAIRRIRSSPGGAQARIITVTANATDDARAQVLAAGADDFMVKPFHQEELFEKIRLLTGVKYIYAGSDRPARAAGGRLPVPTKEMLAVIPAELKKQIREAVVRGRRDRMIELIQKTADIDATLSGRLLDLAVKYDYEAILQQLE